MVQLLASFVFMDTMILPSLDHRFSWSTVPLTVVITGDLLVALGFLIVFLVFKENTFTAATIAVTPDQKVVSTGPYAVVRHPMYSGVLVMLLGTPLALGSSSAAVRLVERDGSSLLQQLNKPSIHQLGGPDAHQPPIDHDAAAGRTAAAVVNNSAEASHIHQHLFDWRMLNLRKLLQRCFNLLSHC